MNKKPRLWAQLILKALEHLSDILMDEVLDVVKLIPVTCHDHIETSQNERDVIVFSEFGFLFTAGVCRGI